MVSQNSELLEVVNFMEHDTVISCMTGDYYRGVVKNQLKYYAVGDQ